MRESACERVDGVCEANEGGGNEGGKKNKAAFAGELVKSWSLPRTSASLTPAHRRATSSEPEVGVARENGKNNCKMCHISCFPQISTRMGARSLHP